ncbi:MAG: oligosaccharide flippase family protein [Vicingaceae bacterium]
MGVIKRQGIKASIVTYLGVLIGIVNTLWIYPKYLKPEEIGLITLLINISLIIAPLAQLGVNGIILKYYPYFKDDPKKEGSFIFFILSITISGFLLAMILLFFCRNLIISSFIKESPLIIDYLIYLVPISFLMVVRNVGDTLARARYRITVPKIFREMVYRVLVVLLIICFVAMHLSLKTLVIGFVVIFFINALLVLIYLNKIHSFKINFSTSIFNKGFLRNSMQYGGYVILSGFASMIITKIDSYMIGSNIGLDDTGIYTIALYIGLAIEMPKRSLNLISLPVISQAMKDNNINKVDRLYKKSAIIQLIIGALLLTCVWINIDDIFNLIPNSELYSRGKYVVLFIGLAVVFDMATGLNNEIILMSNFYKWNLIIMFSLIILAIINNLIFIPMYGITGAAIATAISIFLFNILKYSIVYYHLKIQPFTRKTLVTLLITAVLLSIGLILPNFENSILNILYKGAFISTLFITLHLYFKISEDFNELAQQLFSRIKTYF